jgi:outer membrane protein
LVAAFFGSSLVASAAQKIGVVDIQTVFQGMPQAATIQQTIAAEFRDQKAKVDKLQADLEYELQKLQRESATMSAAEKTALEDKIIKMREEYTSLAQPLQQAFQRRAAEERNKLLDLIKVALDEEAEKGQFDLVLNAQAVTFAKPEFDLSKKVLERVTKGN